MTRLTATISNTIPKTCFELLLLWILSLYMLPSTQAFLLPINQGHYRSECGRDCRTNNPMSWPQLTRNVNSNNCWDNPLLSSSPSLVSLLSSSSNNDNNLAQPSNPEEETTPWNPPLRKLITGVAALGAMETAYLTITKLSGDSVLCPANGSCQSVLNGPYSMVPFTHNMIPLSAIGFLAYTLTAIVSVAPLMPIYKNKNLEEDTTDALNRTILLILATMLGTFSSFLMAILVLFLQESCLYCLASAILSWTLTASVWFGGAIPNDTTQHRMVALQSSVSSFCITTLASLFLFTSVQMSTPSLVSAEATTTGTAISTSTNLIPSNSPPTITTHSSPQAVALVQDLVTLNAKMYGAYWCSHCFDQKQTLGQPAYSQAVQYIECSKDGFQSQSQLCKERNIPGYPTWELSGQLFPGEVDLDELQDMIRQVQDNNKKQ